MVAGGQGGERRECDLRQHGVIGVQRVQVLGVEVFGGGGLQVKSI